MPGPLVYGIILNFKHWGDTLACLESVSRQDYPNLRVAVFDVAEHSRPPDQLGTMYPEVEVFPITENRGYAGNNNHAIRYALDQGAAWVFVLNDDTLLAADCIRLLVKAGEDHPEVGIVGPLVYHANEPTVIQSAGGHIDANWRIYHEGMNEDDRGQYAGIREVDWLNGCGFLVRAGVFAQIGLFDEQYFAYDEEVDFCYRAGQAGWKALVEPAAHLWHKGVQREYKPGPNVTYYMVRNTIYFLRKHRAPLRVRLANWLGDLRVVLSYTLRPRWRGHRPHRDAAWQGMKDAWMGRWGKRSV